MELFPSVAQPFLKKRKEAEYHAKQAAIAEAKPKPMTKPQKPKSITGKVLRTPIPGSVTDVLVQPGDVVEKGQPIAVIYFMEMENSILSNCDGTIKNIFIEKGNIVNNKTILLEYKD
jgi:biotin carboxyl carrier protein